MNSIDSSDWFAKVLNWLQAPPSDPSLDIDVDPVRIPNDLDTVAEIGMELLEGLRSRPPALEPLLDEANEATRERRDRFIMLCRNYGTALQRALLDLDETVDVDLPNSLSLLAGNLYQAVHPYAVSEGEGLFLQVLAWPRTDQALVELTELIVAFPPHAWTATAMGLSPLMRTTDWSVEAVFPRLMAAVHHPTTISPILDLANYCVHREMVACHPASGSRMSVPGKPAAPDSEASVGLEASLTEMLGGVVGRLGLMEDDPTKFGNSPEKIQNVLGDAIALCVSLCNALGLMKHEPAIGKLHQALELRHRRIQAEAAAALARMDQEVGRERLVALAAEPIARLRVLAYAEELHLVDRLDPEFSSPQAVAESELALWLAQPQQLGIPPQTIELIDHRTLLWPSYETPQACWLFRFQYQMAHGIWSNIGMAGPVLHAFAADLAELPVFDIYAAFAGWQAEHPEIHEIPVSVCNPAQQRIAEKLGRALEEQGHTEIQPLWLGIFLGEICLVCESQLDERTGVAVTDGLETIWFPTVGRQRPLGPHEAYAVFKGRKMLRTFNPDLVAELEADE
jgi:hypothetical protein